MKIDLSLVIPLFNEEESLSELANWVKEVCEKHDISYEVLFINDGSNDSSWDVISSLSKTNSHIKGISFRRNYGKSAALNVGFEHAIGNVVITMDADLQDSPDEIPSLYKMIKEDAYDIVSGWKKDRKDPLSKTIPTKLYNGVTRKVLSNLILKAYKNFISCKFIEMMGLWRFCKFCVGGRVEY